MPGLLSIRNITAQPLTLKHVGHFDTSKSGGVGKDDFKNKVTTLTGNFSSFLKTKKDHSSQITNNAKATREDRVDIKIEPFQTKRTQIDTPTTRVLRLFFQNEEDEDRYHIDIPTPSKSSTTFQGPDHGRALTGMYNSNSSVLAIFDSTNLSKWMNAYPDFTPLSALSIPGTHNSPTCHSALPSVRCQAVNPTKQLENGVRFFDVRVQVDDADQGARTPALQLVHSAFPISLTGPKRVKDLFDDIYEFLENNPSETVISSLKREGRGNGTDAIFSERLKEHYVTPNAQRWHTAPGVPTLGEVRGKIVLLRRFGLSDKLKDGKGFGINATNWEDNTANHNGGDIQIQDFYEVTDTENVDKKVNLVCDHFERAGAFCHPVGLQSATASEHKQPLFINFLSASNFWKPGCWPDKIAAKLNPAITEFLCEKHNVDEGQAKGDGGVGIVVCDWVGEHGDWDLVRAIVGMNSRLHLKEHAEDGDRQLSGNGSVMRGRGRGGRGGRSRGRGRGSRGGQA
ncbi:hypothetical protein LTR37_017888 [Vermiconidia calcicola]|uniref:Uncharacterized protein n=1 Tax=Vermiconidia calcicola TaxID=1690605 RepID=A0ACC3MLF3_9PEZI|nr:hypothetical protein LTR37_017888 [Vermiconidia calcicola]